MADVSAAGGEGSVRFGVLGSLVVDGSGMAWPVPAGKQRVLLAALLLGRGRMVSAASLAEALWDGFPPANEPAVLRTYVARLRQVLGPAGPRIVGRPPGWAVELRGHAELDLTEVEHLRAAARAQAGAGNWVQASAHLTMALGMWRGEPLVDVPSPVLVRREAGMLSELRVALTEARVDADLRLGRHGELVAELRQLVAEYPLRERFRVQLMLACVGCGQQAAALEVYRDAYRMLADELGVEPGRELREVHQRILSGDQALAADAPAAVIVHPAARSDLDGPARSRVAGAAAGAGLPRDGLAYSAVTAGPAAGWRDVLPLDAAARARRVNGHEDERAGVGDMASGRAGSGSPGAWLRESRRAAGLTQRELAERSGLALRTISNLELGVSARPHARSIRVLVQALGLADRAAEELVAWYRDGGLPARQWPGPDDGEANGHFDSAAASAGWVLPAAPSQLPIAPRHFVGRREQLAWLGEATEEAAKAEAVVIVAVGGMAGLGKTSLVLHWAHRVAQRFPDGQLFADLRGFGPPGSPVEPAAALHGFLAGLGVPADRIPAGLDAQAGLFRGLTAGRRMLLVLDNARDAEQVRPLLPGSPGCLVLVTSRTRLAGLAVAGNAELLALDLLSAEDARQLLASRIPADRVAAEPDAIHELIGLCAGLPLALAITAARAVAQPELPLAAITADLRDAARRLDALDSGDTATSIRATLSWSYQQLAEPPARMLRLLSVHPGPGITAAAAASLAATPLPQALNTLRALADANLITEYLPGRYTLHDLVRAFAAEQAQTTEHPQDHHAATTRMAEHYLHTVNTAGLMTLWDRDPITLVGPTPGVTLQTFAARDQALAWLDAEHAVLVNVTRRAAASGLDVHAWQLAWSLAVFFRRRGHWRDLAATQRVALAAARRLRDQNAQAYIHRELGLACAQAGRFRQARFHLRCALRLYLALGDHDGRARTHLTMGVVWDIQGYHREALSCALDALRPWPANERPPHKAVTPVTQAMTVNNLGWCHAQLGELDQARTECEHALQLSRGIGSPYGQAGTLDSLGYIHHRLGDHHQAAAYYRLAADQFGRIGELHDLAGVLSRLGDSCQAVDESAAARVAWQEAVHVLRGIHQSDADIQAKLRRLDSADGQVR